MFILLDIHRNILSAQGLFKCKINGISNVEIMLLPNELSVSLFKKSLYYPLYQYCVQLPEKFLLPATVSSVCCNSVEEYSEKLDETNSKLNFPLPCDMKLSSNDEDQMFEITFRIQISSSNALESYISKSVSDTDFKTFMHEKFNQDQSFNVICSDCGALLTEKNISFQSINKYYEGMSEMEESWFCHKHDSHDSVEISSNSLYIGDMHFYFHDSIMKLFLLSENGKELRCSRCSSILSLKKKMDIPHYIGFFCDKIIIINSEVESHDIKSYKSDSALLSFCSIIQDLSKSAVSYKMYLQCKVGEKTDVLLLWINSQAVVQFLKHITEDKKLCEKNLNGKEVYKVLYYSCSPDSEISRKWKHDFGVEFYQISDNMMDVVRGLLQESSKYFPEEERKVKDFSFGYLPVHVSLQQLK